jgi:hypothetical protein
MTLGELLPLLIPLILLEFALMAVGLFDLTRADRVVKGGNKLVWGLVIVFVQFLGPLVYFLFGREDA